VHGVLGRIWREPDADFDHRRFWLTNARTSLGQQTNRNIPLKLSG
jgi:hypothetical protein